MKNKLKIGQVVYAEPINNAARYHKNIKEFVIESLGNKYFTVKNEYERTHRNKFSYETMCDVTGYSPDYQIHLSKKEIEDKLEYPMILKSINDKLNKMSTDELKEILKEL